MKYSVYLSKMSENDIRSIYEYIANVLHAPTAFQVNIVRILYGGMNIDKELDPWVWYLHFSSEPGVNERGCVVTNAVNSEHDNTPEQNQNDQLVEQERKGQNLPKNRNLPLMQHINQEQYRQPQPQYRQISGNEPGIQFRRKSKTGKQLPNDTETAVQPAGIKEDPGKIDFRKGYTPDQPARKPPPGPIP